MDYSAIFDWLGVVLASLGVAFDFTHHYAGEALRRDRNSPLLDGLFVALTIALLFVSLGMTFVAISDKSYYYAIFFFGCIPPILYLMKVFLPEARATMRRPWATKKGLENTMFLLVNALAVIGIIIEVSLKLHAR